MSNGFPKIECIAISVSHLKMSYMSLPKCTKLPDDTEWINVMLVDHNTEHDYVRIGVGQVSKYGWDNWAEPKVKDIFLS